MRYVTPDAKHGRHRWRTRLRHPLRVWWSWWWVDGRGGWGVHPELRDPGA